MSRDEFPKLVIDVLGKRAAFICSNPDCRKLTIAPSADDPEKFLYIGKAAHICAASRNGPRFDASITEVERRSISNGIFLCGNCADMIDKNQGIDFSVGRLRTWKDAHEVWVAGNLNKSPTGVGGEGGSGIVNGNRGVVIGGRGGSGGVAGIGGKGGGGIVNGDDGLVIGVHGGCCATADGRGGRGARGPTERVGFSTEMWGYGRGGSGANSPEYEARIETLRIFRTEYMTRFPDDAPYINSGIEQVPVDWINQRLAECGKDWRVTIGLDGYILPALIDVGHTSR